MPAFPADRRVRHRPDWICEGLSPRTAVVDQGAKQIVFAKTGVPWYWLVEPLNRTLSVLRLSAEGYLVHVVVGDRGTAQLPPFDAVAIDLGSLFPPAAEQE